MQLQAIAKGMALGAAAGMAGYLLSSAGSSELKRLKRKTCKAVRAIGAVMDGVAELLH